MASADQNSLNRIVIFLGSTGHGSGAERVLEYFLAGARARHAEISLLSPPSSSVSVCARDLGYEWIPWTTDHDGIRQNIRAFLRLLRRDGSAPRGNLVHSWHTRHLEWAWALGRRWGTPSAGTLHDDPDPAHDQFGRIRKKIIRHSAAGLDGVVAVSDAVARRCRTLGWTREITVIRNGLPDAPPGRRSSAAPLRLGFLASSVSWKGLALMPELLRRTSDLSLEWHLFGPTSPDTSPLVEELTKNPRVRFHGRVPLEDALRRIDVLLHLSLALDPYPTVLLEAAREGIPAIASDTGGSPEIVVDGRTGVIVPAGDTAATATAIRRLFAAPAERASMSAAARQRFESDFRVERMVADYFSFWDRLRFVRP